MGPLQGLVRSREPATGRGAHLVVGAEAVHLLLEHGHPQVFAQELEDVQLLPEGQRLPGQPRGQRQTLRPGQGGEGKPAWFPPATTPPPPRVQPGLEGPGGAGSHLSPRAWPTRKPMLSSTSRFIFCSWKAREEARVLGHLQWEPPSVVAARGRPCFGAAGQDRLRPAGWQAGAAPLCIPAALRAGSPLLRETRVGGFPTLSLTHAPAPSWSTHPSL